MEGSETNEHAGGDTGPEPFWVEGVEACRRCGGERDGAFCAACGQPEVERLALGRILREAVHQVTSLERGLLRTVVELWRRPGWVVRRYVGGDRTGFTSPARYLLITATVYALVINLLEIDVRPTAAQIDNPHAVRMMRLVISLLGYIMFAYLLPAAAVLRGLFRLSGLNFAEAYAALLFYGGHYLLVASTLALLGVFSLGVGFWLVRFSGLLLLLWVVVDLFRPPPLRAVLASVVVYAMVVVGGFAAGLMVTAVTFLVSGFGWPG